MAQPTSFRLPPELVVRLNEEASEHDLTVTDLVTTLLDEGLKTRRFPGVVYRDGATGRRAGLIGGPDVWEIVRALKVTPGRGQQRVKHLAEQLRLPASRIRVAVDFYAAFPDEIDARIAADERAAERVRQAVEQRERLLAG